MAARIQPVGDGDAVRARVPEVLKVYSETRATVLEDGIVDPALKQLCATYLAEDDDEVMGFERSGRFDARERAALRWTHAVAWDSDTADAELWGELHAHFTQPELVELGYFIAFTLGQMHWLRSIGLSARA